MPVYVQRTPNPNALKFVLPQKQFDRPLNISSAAEAEAHPLAQQLLALEPVYNVFMVQDFVTVNKRPDAPWAGLEEEIVRIMAAYFGIDGEMMR
jgi:hypothetical protein